MMKIKLGLDSIGMVATVFLMLHSYVALEDIFREHISYNSLLRHENTRETVCLASRVYWRLWIFLQE